LYLNEVRPKFKKEKGLRPHSFPDPSCGRMKELRQDETSAQNNASSCRILIL
jgi:hypothetical protein